MKNKSTKIDEMMLYSLFIFVDDTCQELKNYFQTHFLASGNKPARKPKEAALSESEIIVILIYYHYSGYKKFEYYYNKFVLTDLTTYFPKAPSYTHFLGLQSRVGIILFILMQILCQKAIKTDIYYIDSKQVPVCDNLRIKSNKVFQGLAGHGKSSTINNYGEIVSFALSAANKADNNQEILKHLLRHLEGICVGDKGYLTQLWEKFYENGLKIIHKVKKNMKNKLLTLEEKYYLAKRGVIESVNAILDGVFDLTHSRHRKAENAFCHILSCLIAYQFYPNKPSVYFAN